jgi:hypothetical protein
MPDLHLDEATPWLARELSRQLAPVAAPDGLWAGIQEARSAPRRSFSFRWTVWPAFAALTLISCAGLLRELTGVNRLTQSELAEIGAGSKDPDFRSNDFSAIRAWVSAQANIDIDLPPGQSVAGARPVRLIGARLIRFRGSRVAAIDYRVGDRVATLLVSGKRPRLSWTTEPSQHLFSQIRTQGGGRALSWDMGNEVYTIAFAGAREFHGACLICHDY